MTVDRESFLGWVLREHGPRVQKLVLDRTLEEPGELLADPGGLVRSALIEAYPSDFEHQPGLDDLPRGFCSD